MSSTTRQRVTADPVHSASTRRAFRAQQPHPEPKGVRHVNHSHLVGGCPLCPWPFARGDGSGTRYSVGRPGATERGSDASGRGSDEFGSRSASPGPGADGPRVRSDAPGRGSDAPGAAANPPDLSPHRSLDPPDLVGHPSVLGTCALIEPLLCPRHIPLPRAPGANPVDRPVARTCPACVRHRPGRTPEIRRLFTA